MNLADACFTLVWTCAGDATEANPMMAQCLNHSPLLFMVTKLLLGACGVGLLHRLASHRLAQLGAGLCVIVYAAVIQVHLAHWLTS